MNIQKYPKILVKLSHISPQNTVMSNITEVYNVLVAFQGHASLIQVGFDGFQQVLTGSPDPTWHALHRPDSETQGCLSGRVRIAPQHVPQHPPPGFSRSDRKSSGVAAFIQSVIRDHAPGPLNVHNFTKMFSVTCI